VVGFEGALTFDTGKPDGAARKLIDVSRLSAMGWHYTIDLEEGLRRTYDWFQQAEDVSSEASVGKPAQTK